MWAFYSRPRQIIYYISTYGMKFNYNHVLLCCWRGMSPRTATQTMCNKHTHTHGERTRSKQRIEIGRQQPSMGLGLIWHQCIAEYCMILFIFIHFFFVFVFFFIFLQKQNIDRRSVWDQAQVDELPLVDKLPLCRQSVPLSLIDLFPYTFSILIKFGVRDVAA